MKKVISILMVLAMTLVLFAGPPVPAKKTNNSMLR